MNVVNDSVVKIVSNFSSQNNKVNKLIIESNSYTVFKLFDDFETKNMYSRYTYNLKFEDFKKLFSKQPVIINNRKYFIKKSFRKRSRLIKENFISKLDN